MSEDTLFNLRWDAQRQSILSSVSEIFHEESFVDITIVSDDQIFKAHRLILAASSPYLKQALLSVPSEHAVLLLPQVSSVDLANILKFVYEGEIKIGQKNLKSFLQVAKLLKIKGMDFDPNEDITEIPASSKRNSPVREEEPSKRMKMNDTQLALRNNSVTTASPSNNIVKTLDNRDLEHIPSSTADFQIQGYGDTGSSCDREEHDSDMKSDHLDYDKEVISLDDEEEDELGQEYDDDDDQGEGFPFQPEVSFQEGTWGIPHSSTASQFSSSGIDIRRRPILKQMIGSTSVTPTQSLSEGILQRMMREPLKSSSTSHLHQPSNMSISMSHGISQGHGHSLSGYDLQDNIGLRKTAKRYVQCTSCIKVLSSLSALKRHMEDVHCARIQGKCIICGRVYSSRNSLLTHVYSAHKKHHDYKAVARIIRESDFEQFASV